MIYLFGHDTRNLTSSIVLSRKTLTIKRAGLLLGELEPDVFFVDWRAHRTVRASSSSGTAAPKHETGSQLRPTRGSQDIALILLSKSSKSWGGEALREGTAVVALLAETGVVLDFAFIIRRFLLHHDTEVRSVVPHGVIVI